MPAHATPRDAHEKPRRKLKPATPFAAEPTGAFYVFLAANVLAALFAPIHDCDETYNYWEPTHYLSHGYGFQTWEYSPKYAIRSWLYILLHVLAGNLRRVLPGSTKVAEFYFIRCILAFTCALCQTIIFRVINNCFNPRVALFFMMSLVFSPGMYHASVAFLPSSFAMYAVMLGTAAFMNWRGGLKTVQGITWFAIGGLIGWPFAMALCLPFLIEEAFLAFMSGKDALIGVILRFARGFASSLVILVFESLVSSFLYKLPVIVPLNIIFYNVFSGPERGPEIYGTEPWNFYIKNLLLNFNIWFVLALVSLPIFLLQKLVSSDQRSTVSGLRSIVFMSPFYLWLTIFSFQPHKEERFMYPAYPFLALNSAMSLHMLLAALGNRDPKTLIGKIPGRIKLLIVVPTLLLSINIGLLRIYGIYAAYSAPLRIYEPLSIVENHGDTVCLGKEWYRFPSSYHLPVNMRAKFIRSEFNGLLPGQFSEDVAKHGIWGGAALEFPGTNDQNLEDTGRYIDVNACSYLVDTYYPNSTPSDLEPHYILDTSNWEVVKCLSLMDASSTPLSGRILVLPRSPWFLPESWRESWNSRVSRNWGKHCLLKRKTGDPSILS